MSKIYFFIEISMIYYCKEIVSVMPILFLITHKIIGILFIYKLKFKFSDFLKQFLFSDLLETVLRKLHVISQCFSFLKYIDKNFCFQEHKISPTHRISSVDEQVNPNVTIIQIGTYPPWTASLIEGFGCYIRYNFVFECVMYPYVRIYVYKGAEKF